MKRISLLYDNLLSRLHDLTIDGENFSDFYDAQTPDNQASLISLSESIANERRKIKECVVNKVFFSDYSDLISFLDNFKNDFDDFPGFRMNEIYGLITIIQKITNEFSETEINLEEELDGEKFEISKLGQPVYPDNFFYFDDSTIENSIVLFNIHKKAIFKDFIDNCSEGTEILFYLLKFIGEDSEVLSNDKFVLIKKGFKEKPKIVWSCLCIHILSSGGIVHEPIEYNITPSISSNCSIALGKNFHQFADSIDIISEYNDQTDILDKYLRIYHVIENFMYKRPLVTLEKDSNGLPFSIRDFKRMYDKVSDSELPTLKSLCIEIMPLEFNATQNFSDKILQDWKDLKAIHGVDEVKVNKLLKILNIYTNKGKEYLYADILLSNLGGFFGKLIYAFRNSMVHNRETEFHLTHSTLLSHDVVSDTPKIILEKFLLPNLEEIIFNLIIKENDIVWYTNSKLTLWESE